MSDITIALIATGEEGEAAAQWLSTVPGVRLHRAQSLADLVLAGVERIWVHAVTVEPSLELLAWLRAGGRMLATLGAAELPWRLGLEPEAPDDRRQGYWSSAAEEFRADAASEVPHLRHVRGLAAFGPHPLFRGFGSGALTWAPGDGEPYQWLAYRGRRPERGAGVAVERVGRAIHAARWVAWEYEVGEGGLLCLGAFVQLLPAEPRLRLEVRALLANALIRDAIPHSTRAAAATHWPGLLPEEDESALVAAGAGAPSHLEAIWDEWPPTSSTILTESGAREERLWSVAGRRILITGGERAGVHEIWAHPYRLLRQARILVNGQEPEVSLVRLSPDELVRVLRLGEIELTERLTAAGDHGLVFWSIVADGPAVVTLRWETDLRRAAPYPARSSGLRVQAVGDAEMRVTLSHEPGTAQIMAAAGTLTAHGTRCEVQGEGLIRVILAGAASEADLGRTLDALKRRKLRAFRQERMLSSRRIEERLVVLEAPDAGLVRAFAWAKVRLDRAHSEAPGTGRSVLAADCAERPERARFVTLEACRVATAALAAGDRDIARDVLRFCARWRDHGGGAPHEVTTTGLAHYDSAASDAAVARLAADYAAWTGDSALLEKLGVHHGAPDRGSGPHAEGMGDGAWDEWFEGLRRASNESAIVEGVIIGLWGIVPDAMREACAISPRLPDGWNEMTLRRLRVGASTVNLRLRRRPGSIVLRVERAHGPRLRLAASLRSRDAPAGLTLNDEPLGGHRAVFDVSGEEEVRWFSA